MTTRSRAFAHLARWDKPIGIWLLFWPCLWGLFLAPGFGTLGIFQQMLAVVIFFVGAVAMRGAGCIINDLTDRQLDRQVTRTAQRPLASGVLTPFMAYLFLLAHLIVGFFVFLQLQPLAEILAFATVPLIILYPWMKRVTWWPQLFLGIIFNSGVLIAWAAMEETISLVPLVLYASGILWTLAYDTVYAHQDLEDDALIGIRSTARYWSHNSKTIIGSLWVASFLLFGIALSLTDAGTAAFGMLGLAALLQAVAHLFWNPLNNRFSGAFFRFQKVIGGLLTMAALSPLLF